MLNNKKTNKLILILSVLFLIMLVHFSGLLNDFDNRLKDKMYQETSLISNDIYVIGIDEETLSKYGKFESFNREKITELINLLNSGEKKPAVIGIDISIFGRQDEKIDKELVEAVKSYDNIVLCSSITLANVPGVGDSIALYEEPFDELKEASSGIGFSNLIFDNDGVIRHGVKQIYTEDREYKSFDKVIFEKYVQKTGKNLNLDNINNNYYISYTTKSHGYFGSTMAGCSMYRVLEGLYPKEEFSNAIVLVGAYASGMQDNFYTSIEGNNQMYGVEIHANIIDQFIKGINKQEVSGYVSCLIVLVFALVLMILVNTINEKIALVIHGLMGILYLIGTKFVYRNLNIVLPIALILLYLILITVSYIVYLFLRTDFEKKKLVTSYSRYITPELAKGIAQKGESVLTLGGEKKRIGVLFVDIRGFTTMSEKTAPEEVVNILNEYFKITTSAILNNDGMIDKFVGDCTMGLFNAMLDTSDYEYKAVCAGLDMIKNSYKLNDFLKDELKGKVSFGVGVHIGEAVVGNIGTDFRMDYTAIGDTVNTASRIESNAKGNQLLISEDTYMLVKDRFIINDAGYLSLKGKDKPMHVYEVIDKK